MNPFPGLRPFEAADAHLFYGRERQIEELLQRLEHHRFLAVVGPSGGGKSSLVRAGLIPALQRGCLPGDIVDWRVAVCKPGKDPFGSLAQSVLEQLRDRTVGQPLAVCPVSQEVAVAYQEGSLGLIPAEGESRRLWWEPWSRATHLAYSPDGATLALALETGEIRLYSREDLQRDLGSGGSIESGQGPLLELAWLGPKLLLTVTRSGVVRLYSPETQQSWSPPEVSASRTPWLWAQVWGNRWALASLDRVELWQAQGGQGQRVTEYNFNLPVAALALGPQELTVACEFADLWSYPHGQEGSAQWQRRELPLEGVVGASWSPSGRRLGLLSATSLAIGQDQQWWRPTNPDGLPQGDLWQWTSDENFYLSLRRGGLQRWSRCPEGGWKAELRLHPAEFQVANLRLAFQGLLLASADAELRFVGPGAGDRSPVPGESQRQAPALAQFLSSGRQTLGGLVKRRLEPGQALLVFVDQFEELFENSPSTSQAFVDCLLEHLGNSQCQLYVMLTMRSDFLGDCHYFRGLPEALSLGQYLLPRLGRAELQKAIEGPLRLSLDPDLIERILADHSNEGKDAQDDLPRLQHLLARLWQLQPDPKLWDLAFYCHDDRVGAAHCLDTHLQELTQDSKFNYRALFQSLSQFDRKGREIRRRVPLCRLRDLAGASIDQAIEKLRHWDCNVLTPSPRYPLQDQSEIDITHEVILRCWNQLRKEWMPQERERRELLESLRQKQQIVPKPGQFTGPELAHFNQRWKKAGLTAEWAQFYLPGPDAGEQFRQLAKYLKDAVELAWRWLWGTRIAVAAVVLVLTLLTAGATWQMVRVWVQQRETQVARLEQLVSQAEFAGKQDSRLGLRLSALALAVYQDSQATGYYDDFCFRLASWWGFELKEFQREKTLSVAFASLEHCRQDGLVEYPYREEKIDLEGGHLIGASPHWLAVQTDTLNRAGLKLISQANPRRIAQELKGSFFAASFSQNGHWAVLSEIGDYDSQKLWLMAGSPRPVVSGSNLTFRAQGRWLSWRDDKGDWLQDLAIDWGPLKISGSWVYGDFLVSEERLGALSLLGPPYRSGLPINVPLWAAGRSVTAAVIDERDGILLVFFRMGRGSVQCAAYKLPSKPTALRSPLESVDIDRLDISRTDLKMHPTKPVCLEAGDGKFIAGPRETRLASDGMASRDRWSYAFRFGGGVQVFSGRPRCRLSLSFAELPCWIGEKVSLLIFRDGELLNARVPQIRLACEWPRESSKAWPKGFGPKPDTEPQQKPSWFSGDLTTPSVHNIPGVGSVVLSRVGSVLCHRTLGGELWVAKRGSKGLDVFQFHSNQRTATEPIEVPVPQNSTVGATYAFSSDARWLYGFDEKKVYRWCLDPEELSRQLMFYAGRKFLKSEVEALALKGVLDLLDPEVRFRFY